MPARTKSAPAPEIKTDAASERTCILVMGMHRSGTSALGGVLGLLGSALPAHLLEGDGNNREGYFESAPLNALNSEILAALGSRWDDWRALDASADFPKRAAFEDRARNLLEKEFGSASQFVFKDPRNCRIGAFWRPLLREARCRVVALHTLRNPWEVAASLARRDRMMTEEGLLLWLRHTLEAEWLTRDLPRFHTSYDLLMKDWRDLAERAAPALGLTWTHGPDEAAARINNFLARDLRHFDFSLPEEHGAWAWMRETHDIFARWSVTGETAADRARLDTVRLQLDQAEPALQILLEAAGRREKRLRALVEESAELAARVARAESGWRKASEQLADLQILTHGVCRADVEHLEARLKSAEEALQQRVKEAEEQCCEVLRAQSRLATERRMKQEQADLHQRDVMGLKARHARTRARLEEAEAALETMRSTLDAERKRRDTLATQMPEDDLLGAPVGRKRARRLRRIIQILRQN